MRFKGFIGLILLVISVLFIIQNLQAVSLVFFGAKPITLPLSIWILLFTIAGLFVSVIIQSLTKVTGSNSSSRSNNQKIPYSSPPSPNQDREIQPPLTQKSPKIEEFGNFNPTYQEPFDDDFEFLRDTEDSKIQEIYSQPEKGIFKTEEITQNLPEKERSEDKINDSLEANDNNSEDEDHTIYLKTKPRSPLPYSYKPREKTQIRRQQPLPRLQPPPKNEIYDANYRIIKPPSQPDDNRENRDEDEEEWEF